MIRDVKGIAAAQRIYSLKFPPLLLIPVTQRLACRSYNCSSGADYAMRKSRVRISLGILFVFCSSICIAPDKKERCLLFGITIQIGGAKVVYWARILVCSSYGPQNYARFCDRVSDVHQDIVLVRNSQPRQLLTPS